MLIVPLYLQQVYRDHFTACTVLNQSFERSTCRISFRDHSPENLQLLLDESYRITEECCRVGFEGDMNSCAACAEAFLESFCNLYSKFCPVRTNNIFVAYR